jgi:hypothetical protein
VDILDLQPVIDRIKARVPALRQVAGAAGLEAVLEGRGTVTAPAAFVLLREERGGEPDTYGAADQVIDALFAVVLLIDRPGDAMGQRAAVELQPLRAAVRQALSGWVFDAQTGEPVLFERGLLLDFGPSRTCWSDEFSLTYYFEGA